MKKLFYGLMVIALFLSLDLTGQVVNFTNKHQISFRSPLQAPIVVTAKADTVVVTPAQEPVVYLSKQDELKDYVASKFGKDANVAWAILMAESHANPEAVNWNTNHTIDYGCFQINSVHIVKGMKVSDLLDCHKNIDVAYTIYSQQHGFGAWSTFSSGAYKSYLTK